jgi:SARP family transcriptional regulator, regulator of embCAB operon
VEALWPAATPPAVDKDLRALLSKVRRAIGREDLGLHSRYRLALPPDAWIDLEAATAAIHRAEAAVAARAWARAWGPALAALFTAQRGFLPGEEAAWIDDWRRYLDQLETRALECHASACLGIGGPELAAAQRCARTLVEKQPYRESGYRILMETLVATGNGAEAMQVYDRLRCALRDELGMSPSPASQELHARLLQHGVAPAASNY